MNFSCMWINLLVTNHMHLTNVVRYTEYQDCDLLDSAEEPHPISLSENQGGSAPLVLTALCMYVQACMRRRETNKVNTVIH